MKTILTILFLLIMFLLIAKTRISFSPFQVQFKDWKLAVGILLVMVGVEFISRNSYNKAYMEGFNDARETIYEIIKNTKKQ